MFGTGSYPITTKGDVNFVCGTYMVPEVYPKLDNIFAPDAKVIHVDLNAYEIAKNHPVDLGVVSDPKLTLIKLIEALEEIMTDDQKKAAKARFDEFKKAKEQKVKEQKEADKKTWDDVPMHAARFMDELAKQLPNPEDICVFDEALTCSPELNRYLTPTKAHQFLQTRGGSLGVGIPGALALKLAYPDKPAFGFTGDGGSMYTIQALWTAAHHNIGAKFVICNNQSYMLLKLNILQYWREQLGIEAHDFPHPFHLHEPIVDFAGLAQSMGVPGIKVEKPDDIAPAIKKALETDGPFLIDLVLTNEVPG
jgi:benzoylformate decarboxylase